MNKLNKAGNLSKSKQCRPLIPDSSKRNCRFKPSCSKYTQISLLKHGFIRGWLRSWKRIKNCKYPNFGWDRP
ncbi:MAG: membrane protein insertion efficiency factor YidD [Bdellovibrionota bacterium]